MSPKLNGKLGLATLGDSSSRMHLINKQKGSRDDRRGGEGVSSLNFSRRKSGSVEPTSSILIAPVNMKPNRYQERVKAREKLRLLDIVDILRSPQSVMSHGLLTRD